MLIKKLILENYGPYLGRHVIDLEPRIKYNRVHPIVLIGAKNGAGKTTILDGLRLALYGKTSLGGTVKQVDYDEYLASHIHKPRNSIVPITSASVEIEFEHAMGGEVHVFNVERSWIHTNSNKVIEQLKLVRDGKSVDDIQPEHWQYFIRDIIPEGLSKLFFFDGEKISDLANDRSGAASLSESIRALLGLDISERLSADLSIYASREAKMIMDIGDREEVSKIEMEISKCDEILINLNDEIAEYKTGIAGLEAEARSCELEMVSKGKAYADMREALISRKAETDASIGEIENVLRNECTGAFPFALCPNITRHLLEVYANDKESREKEYSSEVIKRFKTDIAVLVKASKDINITVVNIFNNILESVSEKYILNTIQGTFILGESVSQSETDRYIVKEKSVDSAHIVLVKSRELELLIKTRSIIQRDLDKAPKEDALLDAHNELQDINKKMGGLSQKIKACEEKHNSIKNTSESLKRDKEKIIGKIGDKDEREGRISLVNRIKGGLQEYLKRLTRRKVDELKREVAECFNKLSRKGDQVQGVDIDPEDFSVLLYDFKKRVIKKDMLSAGEKQILAISLLWGLAKTSGRPLPVIVDTPLARLDSDHRKNLISKYFPFAAHQVIILSTDTEVDQKLVDEMKKDLSHCIHLGFDPKEGCTIPSQGYFWEMKSNE
jgi:DNA sulfur modification protein DndD